MTIKNVFLQTLIFPMFYFECSNFRMDNLTNIKLRKSEAKVHFSPSAPPQSTAESEKTVPPITKFLYTGGHFIKKSKK